MKKILVIFITILSVQFSYAKKVQFSVNMTGQVISAFGIHVMGDFQEAAGLGTNYSPDSALMIKDLVATNIYTLVVDIPAFAKYEYKFVNGDQSYEVEVVPEKAQVGYNFNDNRWIYIDSLANDTTKLPTFLFSQTSAAGQTMMRYLVDMTLQTVSADGVHIAGDFQAWNPATTRLYSFGNNTYEIIVYGTVTNTYEYKFYNGNMVANAEVVPGACAVNANRAMVLSNDTIASKVCFGACSTCFPAQVSDITSNMEPTIYPNPSNDAVTIAFNDKFSTHHVQINDISGRKISQYDDIRTSSLYIPSQSLKTGIYIITISNQSGKKSTNKLIVE